MCIRDRYSTSHMKFFQEKAESADLDFDSYDVCDITVWNRSFLVNKLSFGEARPPVHAQINVYTDGSMMEERVGAGYCVTKIVLDSRMNVQSFRRRLRPSLRRPNH